jgi:hypothetical protein
MQAVRKAAVPDPTRRRKQPVSLEEGSADPERVGQESDGGEEEGDLDVEQNRGRSTQNVSSYR